MIRGIKKLFLIILIGLSVINNSHSQPNREDEEKKEIDRLLDSDDPKDVQKGWDIINQKALNNPWYKHGWMDTIYRWNPVMKELADRGYAYDMHKSLEENKAFLKKIIWEQRRPWVYGSMIGGLLILIATIWYLRKPKIIWYK